jgi:SAM-dependent methyltransferase
MSLKQRLGSVIKAIGRFPVIASVVYHPAIRGAVQTWPNFHVLYGKGWDLLHPFDRLHRTDTSGFIPADKLPNSPFATTRIHVYAASQPSIVRSVLKTLPPLETFTFIDLGCGKGRPLLVASEFPFLDIIGVELSPSLADIARTNAAILNKRDPSRRRVRVEVGDASTYVFPPGNLVIFLFNPFAEEVIRKVIGGIEGALAAGKRSVYVVYYNPVYGACFDQSPALTRYFAATIPYSDEERGYGLTRADPVVVWQGGGSTPPLPGADAHIEILTPGWSCELTSAVGIGVGG